MFHASEDIILAEDHRAKWSNCNFWWLEIADIQCIKLFSESTFEEWFISTQHRQKAETGICDIRIIISKDCDICRIWLLSDTMTMGHGFAFF